MKKTLRLPTSLVAASIIALAILQACGKNPPNSARQVPLAIAKKQTELYRTLLSNISRDSPCGKALYYRAEVFSRADIETLLSQKGCDGIRIYHAIDEKGRSVMLMVGKTNIDDILPTLKDGLESNKDSISGPQPGPSPNGQDEMSYIFRSEVPCPDVCPKKPVL